MAISALRWLSNYRAQPTAIPRDLVLGLLTGAVFWPLALSHAAIAGVPPDVAIATAVLPALLYLLSGSLPLLSLQSGSTVALCLGEIVSHSEALNLPPRDIACLLAVMVGTLHLIMGLLDYGFVAEIFSQPHLRGRTGSAAVLILISQMGVLLGVPPPEGDLPLEKMANAASSLSSVRLSTCGLSAVLTTVLVIARRWNMLAPSSGSRPQHGHLSVVPLEAFQQQNVASDDGVIGGYYKRCRYNLAEGCFKIMRVAFASLSASSSLVVLVIGSILYVSLGDSGITLIDTVELPWSLSLRLPIVDIKHVAHLAPSAALVAFLAFGGQMAVVERVRKEGDEVDARCELMALGIAGLGAAAVGGMPVMANFAVSQRLERGLSGLATLGSVAGHFIAFTLVALVPVFQRIPACAIAAILVVEFAPLLTDVPRDIVRLLGEARQGGLSARKLVASDLGIYLAALLSPLALGIVRGSLSAVALELLCAVARFAGPGYCHIGRIPGGFVYDELGVEGSFAEELSKIIIVRFLGPRWFGNAAATTRIARQERLKAGREIRYVIVDLRMTSFFDETALVHYKREWSKPRNHGILVTNACGHVRRQIKDSGILTILQQPEETLLDLHTAVCYAERLIQQEEETQVVIGAQER